MKCIADGKDQKNEEKEERLHGPILMKNLEGATFFLLDLPVHRWVLYSVTTTAIHQKSPPFLIA
jgi:hypothetical protein